jgi:RimJ/RimL family protein N-acetyltransferase
MNPVEYLHFQLRLEGKEVVNENLLRQVEAVPGEDMPLMILGFLATQDLVAFYDESLPAGLIQKLNDRLPAVKFPNVDLIVSLLQSHGFKLEVSHYKTYIFPAHDQTSSFREVRPYAKHEPKVQEFGFDNFAEEVYALEQVGRIVSACVSSRENKQCAEAWVYTDANYRNQGLAGQVVRAWAWRMNQAGKVPFYSHKIENTASASLAAKLGLVPVFEEVIISYKNV